MIIFLMRLLVSINQKFLLQKDILEVLPKKKPLTQDVFLSEIFVIKIVWFINFLKVKVWCINKKIMKKIMKKIYCTLILFLFFHISYAQAYTCNVWKKPNAEIIFVWDLIQQNVVEVNSWTYKWIATFQVVKKIKWKIPDKITIHSWEYSPGLGWLWNLIWRKIIYASKDWDTYRSWICSIYDYSWFIFIWEYKVGIFLVILLFFILFRRKIQNYYFTKKSL